MPFVNVDTYNVRVRSEIEGRFDVVTFHRGDEVDLDDLPDGEYERAVELGVFADTLAEATAAPAPPGSIVAGTFRTVEPHEAQTFTGPAATSTVEGTDALSAAIAAQEAAEAAGRAGSGTPGGTLSDEELAELKVEEVHAYVNQHPDEKDRVVALEQARENPRKGVLALAEE